MHKHIFVTDLAIGQEVETPLAVYDKQLRQYTAKNGQAAQVLTLTVGDKTGRMAAVVWDNAQELHRRLAVDQVHLFQGRVGEYRGQAQLVVNRVSSLDIRQLEPTDYLMSAALDREVLWQRLAAVVRSIQHPSLRTLLERIFTEDMREKFKLAPGGREVHHAYAGGLLEHTLEVIAYAETMLQEQGSHLNRDLLMAGCILHDIGKLAEYDLNSLTFQMTDQGKLLGHLQVGVQLVASVAATIPDFPADLRMELEHMILSHHGLPEWGAAQIPKTVNAMALHLADLTSSRLSQFARIIGEHDSGAGKWSNWDKFLARSILVPEPEAGQQV